MQTALVDADPIPSEKSHRRWGLARRVAFRFVFLYVLLYSLCYLLPIPASLREVVVSPVSAAVFDRPARWHPTGSGDTWFDWVSVLVIAVVAILGGMVWSVFDRRRSNYARLFDVQLVILRFLVGLIVIGYGFAKMWPLQFPPPSVAQLIKPVGSMSPMGLLWTFMGHSTLYSVFAGLLEVVGAALLFFRRTTLLGALILIGILANVAMLNLAYDVPVKQFSLHLVAFCVLIAAPGATRLLRFFVLDSERQPRKRLAVVGVVIAGLAVCFQAAVAMLSSGQNRQLIDPGPFDGWYEVEELSRGGQVVPPLLSEATRWHRVGIGSAAFSAITVDATHDDFRMILKPDHTGMTLIEPAGEYPVTVTRIDGDLVMDGTLRGATFHARLRKLDDSRLVLTHRGFHWVQEDPFSR